MTVGQSSLQTTTRPYTQTLIVVGAIACGILLAYLWSYEFVDKVVADGIARIVLREDLAGFDISSIGAGLLFAFVSGVAGTLTACNACVLAATIPLAPKTGGPAAAISSLVPFIASLLIVASGYGVIGVLLGSNLPQLSSETVGAMPVRLMQAGVVFVGLGTVLLAWGVLILRHAGNEATTRGMVSSNLVQIVLGVVVAAFLIGRPFPPFRRMFEDATARGDVMYGAAAFGLQAIGNVAFVIVLVLLLATARRGAVLNWLGDHPRARAGLISVGFMLGGTFMVAYWGIRVPAIFLGQ
ncbi:hypothetical protein [Mesorhizobium sp. L-8-3]|uniref:hypothetical protein n=1 Tax=Mesorhizobium sp. L-8-3 TaxID=2744522 RepID=UPI0019297C86|nr:hypothetical protein [Mesorhizobium sp. L-8-3]BCH27801.1 hypothetical protein MesoLjLb_75860 [Mesorhizobium sp. L-8-3]